MKKNLIYVLLVIFTISTLSLIAAKVDVTGKWEMTMQSPRGERTHTIEMKQNGEELTVISEGRNGETREAKGTVKENKIEWSMTRETPRGTFTMSYTGIIDGDTMSGEAEFGQMGNMEWTAKRIKD